MSPPARRRPLGDRQHRVVRRVRVLVRDEELAEPVDVEGHLGDHRTVDPGEVGGDERRLAAVAAEQLDDRDPLVGAGRRAQVVDELDAARDRRRKPDAVVRPVDVVVHRLRDRDHGHALVVHPQRVRQRVVAADRDQHVDPERLDDPERVVGEVERAVAARCERRDAAGTSSARTRLGFVRDVCRNVPPVRSIVRTVAGVSVWNHRAADAGSSRSCCRSPAQPRRRPTTSCPSCATRLTTALMHGLSPGTSPPPVRIPIRMTRSYQ